MVELFANSGDPDQTPRSAASDLGLHYLPITLLWVSRLQWVKHADWIANWKRNRKTIKIKLCLHCNATCNAYQFEYLGYIYNNIV